MCYPCKNHATGMPSGVLLGMAFLRHPTWHVRCVRQLRFFDGEILVG